MNDNMSHRSTHMLMILAKKNKLLREKFRNQKKMISKFEAIDPTFFPGEDESDDENLEEPMIKSSDISENDPEGSRSSYTSTDFTEKYYKISSTANGNESVGLLKKQLVTETPPTFIELNSVPIETVNETSTAKVYNSKSEPADAILDMRQNDISLPTLIALRSEPIETQALNVPNLQPVDVKLNMPKTNYSAPTFIELISIATETVNEASTADANHSKLQPVEDILDMRQNDILSPTYFELRSVPIDTQSLDVPNVQPVGVILDMPKNDYSSPSFIELRSVPTETVNETDSDISDIRHKMETEYLSELRTERAMLEQNNIDTNNIESIDTDACTSENLKVISQSSKELSYTKKGTSRKRKRYDTTLEQRIGEKKNKTKSRTFRSTTVCIYLQKKCLQNISEDRRKNLNELFWDLKSSDRKTYMLHHTSCQPVKQRTVREVSETDYRRQKSIVYNLKDGNGTTYTVCKRFFLSTLGFHQSNDKPLQTALKNFSNSVVAPKPPHNKIDDTPIREHILGFNPNISHYRREHAPNRLYLPSDLSVKTLHGDFIKKNPSITCSYEKYRNVVRALNISFVNLGHEECEKCEEFKLHDDSHNEQNLKDDCEHCGSWVKHIRKARDSRENYQKDADLIVDDTIIYSADLQKVIMLPRVDMFKTAIFINRLVVYNESFVPVGKKQNNLETIPVLWHEAVSGRSKDELISSYYKFFNHHRDVKKIILWGDNCSAQNKNWAFFSFLIYIVNSGEISAETITVKYFETGHTFMSADSFHHRVELSMKKMKNKLYDFEDFCQAVGSSAKHVNVKKMALEDFYNWPDYASQYKLARITPRPYINDMVQVTVQRGSHDFFYKTDHNKDAIAINFISQKILKNNILPPPQRKTKPVGIKQEKKLNLIKQLGNLMPNRQQFWLNLPESE